MSEVRERASYDSVVGVRIVIGRRQGIGRIVVGVHGWWRLLRRRMRLPLIVVGKEPGDQVWLGEGYVPDVVTYAWVFCVFWSATGRA